MRMDARRAAAVAALTVLVAGCVTPPAASSPTPDRTSAPAPTSAAPASSPSPTGSAERPAFLSMELRDVRTGETFTLGGFPGQVVLVQAMAVW